MVFRFEVSEIEVTEIQVAAILTAIGMGTAFGILVLLMLVIMTTGWITSKIPDSSSDPRNVNLGNADGEGRDKAIAAIVAVTALLSRRQRSSG